MSYFVDFSIRRMHMFESYKIFHIQNSYVADYLLHLPTTDCLQLMTKPTDEMEMYLTT